MGAWAPGADGLWNPVAGAVVNRMFKTSTGKTLVFTGSKSAISDQFRSIFFFHMPYAMSPLAGTSTEYRLIRGDSIHVFSVKNFGFRLSATLPLPAPPGISSPATDPEEKGSAPARGFDPKNKLRVKAWVEGAVGYQLDEEGSLYWIGNQGIFKHEEGGWKSIWTIPSTFNTRNDPGLIILPGHRIGVFGTEEAFFMMFDLSPADSKEPKKIASISYDSLGTSRENLAHRGGGEFIPRYCVAGDHLFFYLPYVGRMFRMKLDSWNLTEYDVPWMAEMGNPNPNGQPKWLNADGKIPDNPILPETVAFSPRPDGTVHARALLWNMPMPVIHCFDLGSEGSTIHSEIKVDKELKDPLVLVDPLGNLVPLDQMLRVPIEPAPDKSPTSKKPVSQLENPTPKGETP
jgi:hypothetical protein